MTQTEIIKRVAEATGKKEKEVKEVYQGMMHVIEGALREGEEVQLKGYVTFRKGVQSERECRNPITGEKIVVPEKAVVRVKTGSKLKGLYK